MGDRKLAIIPDSLKKAIFQEINLKNKFFLFFDNMVQSKTGPN